MKLHIVTVGSPKLPYAISGFAEYTSRLKRHHQLRVTHLNDKYASDDHKFQETIGGAYVVALVIDGGKQLSSHELATFLEQRAGEGGEVCFLVGGPDGLPPQTIASANYRWSLSPLTFPHDLAMVIVSEALYRATTIAAGHPYHH
jgi:23S rRNA (pseudouridine1915-N3)-methyltransferase